MTDLAALTSCPQPMWKAAQLIYFGGFTMVLGASRGAGSVNLAVGWNPRFFTASFPHFLFAAGMSIVRANNSHYWTVSASLWWKEESHLLVSSSLHLLTIVNGPSSTFFFVFLFASLYNFSLLLRKQHPLLGMWVALLQRHDRHRHLVMATNKSLKLLDLTHFEQFPHLPSD